MNKKFFRSNLYSARCNSPSFNWIVVKTALFSQRGQFLAFFSRIDLENVWGHVNFYARGAGQAVAQLDVNYGVDFEPFKVRNEKISEG